MKFAKSTTIRVSLSFMSTPLPSSSSDDFEQSKNTIFMKHPPDFNYCLLNFIKRLICDTAKVPGVSFHKCRHLTLVRSWVSTPLPGLHGDYHKHNFRKSWVRYNLCFDHVNEKWKTSNISCILACNKIVDHSQHSDVVVANTWLQWIGHIRLRD